MLALPQPNTAQYEIFKSCLSLAVALVTLGFTWAVGQRLSAGWSVWQKRREIDLQTATSFYDLYGEFMTVWRLWRPVFESAPSDRREEERQTLMERIVTAEGKLEAVFVRFATERKLTDEDIRDLGLYRMGYRQLREALRQDRDFDWHWGTPDYHLLKRLACRIAARLRSTMAPRPPGPDQAGTALMKLTRMTDTEWKRAAEEERHLIASAL